MFKWGRKIALGLIFFDAWVSYAAIRELSGSSGFAIAMAAAIAVSQWIISEALFGTRFTHFFVLDRNFDQTVTLDEWIKWTARITTVFSLTVIDVITNVSSIDAYNFGRLIWVVPGIPNTEQTAHAFSFFCAILLAFLDELIMVVIDGLEEIVDVEMPALTVQYAQRKANLIRAEQQASSILSNATGDKPGLGAAEQRKI